MWISKERYEEFMTYERHISVLTSRINSLFTKVSNLQSELDACKEELNQKTDEINSYKEKYANEVQKRLSLIEQFETRRCKHGKKAIHK